MHVAVISRVLYSSQVCIVALTLLPLRAELPVLLQCVGASHGGASSAAPGTSAGGATSYLKKEQQ